MWVGGIGCDVFVRNWGDSDMIMVGLGVNMCWVSVERVTMDNSLCSAEHKALF